MSGVWMSRWRRSCFDYLGVYYYLMIPKMLPAFREPVGAALRLRVDSIWTTYSGLLLPGWCYG